MENKIDALNIASLAELKNSHILQTYMHFNGNKSATAKSLGISEKTMYNWLNRNGIKLNFKGRRS